MGGHRCPPEAMRNGVGGRGARASCALHYWGKNVLSSGEPATLTLSLPQPPTYTHTHTHMHAREGNAVLPIRACPPPTVQVF